MNRRRKNQLIRSRVLPMCVCTYIHNLEFLSICCVLCTWSLQLSNKRVRPSCAVYFQLVRAILFILPATTIILHIPLFLLAFDYSKRKYFSLSLCASIYTMYREEYNRFPLHSDDGNITLRVCVYIM